MFVFIPLYDCIRCTPYYSKTDAFSSVSQFAVDANSLNTMREYPPFFPAPNLTFNLCSKSDFGPLAAYQDLTASFLVNKGGAKGCFWNQDVEALCRGAGLEVVRSSPALAGGLFRTLECVPAKVKGGRSGS